MLCRQNALQPEQKGLFAFLCNNPALILPPLITPAAVQFFDALVEEWFYAGVIDLLPQDLLPVRNLTEQLDQARWLIRFHQLEQCCGILDIKSIAG